MTLTYSLDGQWQFTRLSESTLDERSIPVKALKPRKIKVPSNWYLEGEDFAGEALYETAFEVHHLEPGQAAFLRFNGSDYFTKVELNGKLLGYHEGYFQTFDLVATQALEVENHLRVWVESPKENRKIWPHHKILIKGIFNHHDARPGSWDEERGQDQNTGGLWNSVELLVVDRVFLKQVRVHPVLLPNGQAVVQFKLTLLNVAEADDYDIELKVTGEGFPGFLRDQEKPAFGKGPDRSPFELDPQESPTLVDLGPGGTFPLPGPPGGAPYQDRKDRRGTKRAFRRAGYPCHSPVGVFPQWPQVFPPWNQYHPHPMAFGLPGKGGPAGYTPHEGSEFERGSGARARQPP